MSVATLPPTEVSDVLEPAANNQGSILETAPVREETTASRTISNGKGRTKLIDGVSMSDWIRQAYKDNPSLRPAEIKRILQEKGIVVSYILAANVIKKLNDPKKPAKAKNTVSTRVNNSRKRVHAETPYTLKPASKKPNITNKQDQSNAVKEIVDILDRFGVERVTDIIEAYTYNSKN